MALRGATSAGSAERPVERLRSLNGNAPLLPRRGLPARQTSFVGRSMELQELTELLAAPDCRLLTIIGPGGIGKTRLALEVADATRELFSDGIAYLPLQSLSAGESIVPALAVTIGCSLAGQGNAREQVARFLRPMRLLLVMDNFEHLLGEAPWLGDLLAEAPGLRVLATSRQVLNLREEWRYPLAGLAVPDEKTDDPGRSEAVRLFVERARQVRREFSLQAEQDGIVRLCRTTEGLPLALELAAAWVTTLPCDAIAEEIERNIAFLETDLRNIPARHRSMQAAFDHSWALLTAAERRVFSRLAVFRGGFRRDAAMQIADATLPLLSSLVDKSLVRYEAGGRFHLHELLRQYAEEHLRDAPDEAARAFKAHREFYLRYVADRFAGMTGAGQREAAEEIATELSNIRAAWQGAVAAGDSEALGRASHPLTLFFDFRARYREGLALLEEGLPVLRAAESSPQVARSLAAMLVDTVRLNHRLSQLPAMRSVLAESEARYAELTGPPPPGQMTDPRVWRALLELIDGHYEEAAQLGAEVIERNLADDRPGNLQMAWWVRTAATLWQQDTDAAGEYARRCAEASRAVGDRWALAYAHNMQGHVAIARGDYADAWRYYEASYAIREEFSDPEGMGTSLVHLAKVATLQGAWEEAERLYRRGLAIARDIGDMITMANALNGLGITACASGDYAAAGGYFAEGLRLVAESGFRRLLLTLLASAGDWLLQTGRPAEAVGPLALARSNPASDHETHARAGQLLATAAAALPPETYDAAIEDSRKIEPAELATLLIPTLTAPLPPMAPLASVPSIPKQSTTTTVLIEPLTARESEVLRLIASGRSNREIADELFLAVNTVRSYSQQLYGKLGVGSRTQAVARARELGLLS